MLQRNIKPGVAGRVGSWSARHCKSVLAGWLVFVAVSFLIGSHIPSQKLTKADQVPGQSGQAEQVLQKSFPAPAQETILIHNPTLTADSPPFRAVIRDVRGRLAALPVVTHLHTANDPGQRGMVSADRHSALITFDIAGSATTAQKRIAPVEAAVAAAQRAHPSTQIEEFGDASVGAQIDTWFQNSLQRAMTLSLPVTLIILVIAFGALMAAGIPVLLAFSAVFATIGLVSIPSHLFPISDNTSIVITLIGMAVGVDYSLFYLKREREERAAGSDDLEAVETAAATSGRAILASGLTVMVAMGGQFLTGDKESASFAVGTVMVVAVAMLGSLTALPATLALVGRHVDKGRVRIPFRRKRQKRSESRIWSAVLDRVLARPLVSAIAAVAVLLALAAPALSFKVHNTTTSDLPRDLPGYRVIHDIQQAFPNNQASAEIVVQAPDTRTPAVTTAIAKLSREALTSGTARPPIRVTTNTADTVAVIAMPLPGNGSDRASNTALDLVRGTLIPGTLGRLGGVTTNVTGETAINQDQASMLSHNTPLVFGFVLSLAFILLLVTFRSMVIPIKAIILNLLSVAAAYGVLVTVFQNGHGASLLGFTPTGGIAPWLPLFLFVILFGLSMDYHVFILSRIKELVDEGLPTDEAVSRGIKSTAGVVTSAALVMVGVFSIFITLSLVDFKEFGVGLASAILIDATIIRGVLLPATMKLLGDWNWYLPRPLRSVPRRRGQTCAIPALEVAGE